jgi:hypothetical protein
VSRLVPEEGLNGGASASAAYRSPGMVTRHELALETHATATLPPTTLQAAALLRVAVCAASAFALPVVAVIVFESQRSAIFYLGGSGLLLASGQLLARRSLLTARPSSPAVARGVGLWTILHNVAVVACVYGCGRADAHLDEQWDVVRAGGVAFLLYALCSFGLGCAILRAAAPQRRWLEENSALAPAAVA